MSDEVAPLRASVVRLVAAARAEGIEPDGPLGLWLVAQAGALEGLASVLDGQTTRIEAVLDDVREVAGLELQNAAGVSKRAAEALRQGELALAQVRHAQIHLHITQDNLVRHLVNETLPLFAQHMKEVLVIRERGWNDRKSGQRFAMAGLVALGVFLAGFVVRTGVDWGRLDVVDRCSFHSTMSNGHVFCDLTASAG